MKSTFAGFPTFAVDHYPLVRMCSKGYSSRLVCPSFVLLFCLGVMFVVLDCRATLLFTVELW